MSYNCILCRLWGLRKYAYNSFICCLSLNSLQRFSHFSLSGPTRNSWIFNPGTFISQYVFIMRPNSPMLSWPSLSSKITTKKLLMEKYIKTTVDGYEIFLLPNTFALLLGRPYTEKEDSKGKWGGHFFKFVCPTFYYQSLYRLVLPWNYFFHFFKLKNHEFHFLQA